MAELRQPGDPFPEGEFERRGSRQRRPQQEHLDPHVFGARCRAPPIPGTETVLEHHFGSRIARALRGGVHLGC